MQTNNLLIQGASRGIGLALVKALLAQPTTQRIIATSRHPERSEALQQLHRVHAKRLRLIAMDITQETSVVAAAQQTREETTHLDLLINVSGLLHHQSAEQGAIAIRPERKLADIDPAALHALFAINSIGPVLVAKHFHPLLCKRQRPVLAQHAWAASTTTA